MDATKDQIANILLQRGTPKQQKEALEYAGVKPSTGVSGYDAKIDTFKTTKIIEYRCGCSITLSRYGHNEAQRCCLEHLEPVKKITTIEEAA